MILKILDYSRSKTFNLRVAPAIKLLILRDVGSNFVLLLSGIPEWCHVCLLLLFLLDRY